jgi:hypothetical protein
MTPSDQQAQRPIKTSRVTPIDKIRYLQERPNTMTYHQMQEYLGKSYDRCIGICREHGIVPAKNPWFKIEDNPQVQLAISQMFLKVRYRIIAAMLDISEQALRKYLKRSGLVKQVKKTKKYKTLKPAA